MSRLYTSLIGAFLSRRTIGGRIRKVPMLAMSGRVGKQPYYKEKYGEMVLSARKGSHIRDLDLGI